MSELSNYTKPLEKLRYSSYVKSKLLNKSPPTQMESDEIYRFIKWIDEIEDIIFAKMHVYLLDISDQDYMLMFENGYDTQDAATYIMNDEFDECF